MSYQLKLTILFLIANFGGLAIGNYFMGNGASAEWYVNLKKAPWNPPGFVFGIAWTTIMICFSIYLGKQFTEATNKGFLGAIFIIHFLLNTSWNYIFFKEKMFFLGVVNLLLLTSLLFIYYFKLSDDLGNYKYLLLPYLIWLCVASSLNIYIYAKN